MPSKSMPVREAKQIAQKLALEMNVELIDVELVKEHSKNAPLTVTAYGVTYLVFYADITQSLTVYYPAYHDYTWSGVGKDGVILTLTEKTE